MNPVAAMVSDMLMKRDVVLYMIFLEKAHTHTHVFSTPLCQAPPQQAQGDAPDGVGRNRAGREDDFSAVPLPKRLHLQRRNALQGPRPPCRVHPPPGGLREVLVRSARRARQRAGGRLDRRHGGGGRAPQPLRHLPQGGAALLGAEAAPEGASQGGGGVLLPQQLPKACGARSKRPVAEAAPAPSLRSMLGHPANPEAQGPQHREQSDRLYREGMLRTKSLLPLLPAACAVPKLVTKRLLAPMLCSVANQMCVLDPQVKSLQHRGSGG